jgi:hypothetical protein
MTREGFVVASRLLGCLLHRTGLCLVLVMLRRNDLDFAATGTPFSKSAQLKTFFQPNSEYVLTYFLRILRYFMIGNLSAVVLVPWLGRCEEWSGINILVGMGIEY